MRDAMAIREGGGGADRAGTTILRRALVASASATSPIQDLIDCAELAGELGHADAARLMWETAFLRQGYSKPSMAQKSTIAASTRLWTTALPRSSDDERPDSGFVIDRALRELQGLLAIEPRFGSFPSTGIDDLAVTALLDGAERTPKFDLTRMGGISTRLFTALGHEDVDALRDVLDDIRREIVDSPPLLLSDHAFDDVARLAAAVTACCLRHFFLLNYDLCWQPLGSPRLFLAAARLPTGGLGTYLTDVGRLIRDSRDFFGLVHRAQISNPRSRDDLQQWLVVLATHLDEHARIALANDAGDRRLTWTLRGLLASARRTRGRGFRIFWVIRDAALDNGDIVLAAEAQADIVSLAPGDANEWGVLGEILGTGGAVSAEAALLTSLRLSPSDPMALERLNALRDGQFGAFEVLQGFGSPPWRVALRHRGPNGVSARNDQ